MFFEIIGGITDVTIIARGVRVRPRQKLNKRYGRGRWRKLKGIAMVRLPNRRHRLSELHWYEAHGIGKKDIKIKRFLD